VLAADDVRLLLAVALAEDAGVGRTGFHAGRHLADVDAVIAEIAFGGDAAGRARDHRAFVVHAAVGEHGAVVGHREALLVGAGQDAAAAADAFVPVDEHDAVLLAGVGRLGRADVD